MRFKGMFPSTPQGWVGLFASVAAAKVLISTVRRRVPQTEGILRFVDTGL